MSVTLTEEHWKALFKLWWERHGTDQIRAEDIYKLGIDIGLPLADLSTLHSSVAKGKLGTIPAQLARYERTHTLIPFERKRVNNLEYRGNGNHILYRLYGDPQS